MPGGAEQEILTVDGREVAISNPRKVLFPGPGWTKLDLARYYLAVAEGALRAAGGRPNMMVRDRKSTRLNSSHVSISYAVFCLKKKKRKGNHTTCKYR